MILFLGFSEIWQKKANFLEWAELGEGFPGGASGKEPSANAEDEKMRVQSLGQEDSLEKDMATHSSFLAWKILWTEEPGGLQSMGLQSRIWLKQFSMHTHMDRVGEVGFNMILTSKKEK